MYGDQFSQRESVFTVINLTNDPSDLPKIRDIIFYAINLLYSKENIFFILNNFLYHLTELFFLVRSI